MKVKAKLYVGYSEPEFGTIMNVQMLEYFFPLDVSKEVIEAKRYDASYEGEVEIDLDDYTLYDNEYILNEELEMYQMYEGIIDEDTINEGWL